MASDLPADADFPVVDSAHVETKALASWHRLTEDAHLTRINDCSLIAVEERALPPLSLSITPPISHPLYFWAQSGSLKVDREPLQTHFSSDFTRYGSYRYHILVDIEGEDVPLGKIYLNKLWRE
jgi:hypothetical protein